jgi:hypothetical protein
MKGRIGPSSGDHVGCIARLQYVRSRAQGFPARVLSTRSIARIEASTKQGHAEQGEDRVCDRCIQHDIADRLQCANESIYQDLQSFVSLDQLPRNQPVQIYKKKIESRVECDFAGFKVVRA